MRILSKTLASGDEGSWKIVFDRKQLHVYVGFAEDGAVPDDGMTVEDFLTTVPKNKLHREAHRRFVRMLTEMLT